MATKKLKKLILNGESYNLPNNSDYVDLSTAQSVGGVKTFTSAPVVPSKTSAAANSGTAVATEAQVYLKQDKLTAGTNITIASDGYTISATDTTYTEVSKSDMDTGTSTTAGVVSAKSIADYVSGRVSNTYTYKGSKATYGDLPSSGNAVGDVWNVEAAHTTAPVFPAGSNVAWTGTDWDVLGGIFDTSSFVNVTDAQTVGGVKTFTSEPVLPTKTTAATNTGTKPATEAQVYLKQDKLTQGSNITITTSGGTTTISATDTTYESKAAASGGNDVSLVTTGEKYTWNNKADTSDIGNATITFKQGIDSAAIGTMTANQSSNGTITFHDSIPTTQSDYNDLPASKATDGNSYWIYESVA